MKKNIQVLRFGLFSIGLVFLCNPNVNIIDVLPDCIGYLCLILAVSKAADLCDDLAEAKRAFVTCFWIALSKLPALLLMAYVLTNSVGEQTLRLVFAFSYAALEGYFTLRAFALLFDGFAYFGTREPGGEFLCRLPQKPPKRRADGTVKMRRPRRFESLMGVTALFTVVKNVCSVLPELVYLVDYDATGNVTLAARTLASFYPVVVTLSVIPVLAVGILWLCKLLRYVRYIRKPSEFWAACAEKWQALYTGRQGIFIMRRIYAFVAVATAAAFFAADMYLDEINRIPDFIAAVLFFVAAHLITRDAQKTRGLKIASVFYFLTSVITFVTMIAFKNEYAYRSVQKIERAATLYTRYAVANLVQQIAFVAVVICLAAVIRRVVHAHTGINTLTGVSSSSKPLEAVYAARTVRMCVWGVLSAVMSSLYFYFVVDVQSIKLRTGGYTYFPKFEIAWMVDLVLSLIFALYTANLLGDLIGEVRYKYKYE